MKDRLAAAAVLLPFALSVALAITISIQGMTQ